MDQTEWIARVFNARGAIISEGPCADKDAALKSCIDQAQQLGLGALSIDAFEWAQRSQSYDARHDGFFFRVYEQPVWYRTGSE